MLQKDIIKNKDYMSKVNVDKETINKGQTEESLKKSVSKTSSAERLVKSDKPEADEYVSVRDLSGQIKYDNTNHSAAPQEDISAETSVIKSADNSSVIMSGEAAAAVKAVDNTGAFKHSSAAADIPDAIYVHSQDYGSSPKSFRYKTHTNSAAVINSEPNAENVIKDTSADIIKSAVNNYNNVNVADNSVVKSGEYKRQTDKSKPFVYDSGAAMKKAFKENRTNIPQGEPYRSTDAAETGGIINSGADYNNAVKPTENKYAAQVEQNIKTADNKPYKYTDTTDLNGVINNNANKADVIKPQSASSVDVIKPQVSSSTFKEYIYEAKQPAKSYDTKSALKNAYKEKTDKQNTQETDSKPYTYTGTADINGVISDKTDKVIVDDIKLKTDILPEFSTSVLSKGAADIVKSDIPQGNTDKKAFTYDTKTAMQKAYKQNSGQVEKDIPLSSSKTSNQISTADINAMLSDKSYVVEKTEMPYRYSDEEAVNEMILSDKKTAVFNNDPKQSISGAKHSNFYIYKNKQEKVADNKKDKDFGKQKAYKKDAAEAAQDIQLSNSKPNNHISATDVNAMLSNKSDKFVVIERTEMPYRYKSQTTKEMILSDSRREKTVKDKKDTDKKRKKGGKKNTQATSDLIKEAAVSKATAAMSESDDQPVSKKEDKSIGKDDKSIEKDDKSIEKDDKTIKADKQNKKVKGDRRRKKIPTAETAATAAKYGIKTQMREQMKKAVLDANESAGKMLSTGGKAILNTVKTGISSAAEDSDGMNVFKVVDASVKGADALIAVEKGGIAVGNSIVKMGKAPKKIRTGAQKLKEKAARTRKFMRMCRQKGYLKNTAKKAVKRSAKAIVKAIINAVTSTFSQLIVLLVMLFIVIIVIVCGAVVGVCCCIWQTPTDLDLHMGV